MQKYMPCKLIVLNQVTRIENIVPPDSQLGFDDELAQEDPEAICDENDEVPYCD